MSGSKKPNKGSKKKRERINKLNPRGNKHGGKRVKNRKRWNSSSTPNKKRGFVSKKRGVMV